MPFNKDSSGEFRHSSSGVILAITAILALIIILGIANLPLFLEEWRAENYAYSEQK